MPKMKSMKMSKSEATKSQVLVEPDPPAYPWGLRLSLSAEELEKLSINTLPDVGAKLSLIANVEVVSKSQHQDTDGGDHKSVDLQITDMAIEPERSTDKDQASILYPGQQGG